MIINTEFGGWTYEEVKQRGDDHDQLSRVDVNEICHFFAHPSDAEDFYASLTDGDVAGDPGDRNEITIMVAPYMRCVTKYVRS